MACPDENVLGEFARGGMAAEERAQVESHLDHCHVCCEVVSELTRIFASSFAQDEPLPAPEPEPSLGHVESTIGDGDDRWISNLPLPEGTKLGRYVVLRAIGAGAMGIVYSAYDPELDRKVALKLLRPGPGPSVDVSREQPDRNKRLLREAQALARLSHPNVITVHDVGTVEDQVFLAMEFVEGGTLTAWLGAQTRPWREVLRVFVQAGQGLAAAHEAGLVHRDFKPDNVLLHADGRAIVTDFGLARPLVRGEDDDATVESVLVSGSAGISGSGSALNETLTRTGALVGTPAYMAPEQLEGRRSDAKADQFGFCVALYEGLYGERPFRAKDLTGLVAAVFEGNVAPPRNDRNVPRGLRRAVLRGLRVRPEQRHADMRALLAELRPPGLGSWRGVAAIGALGVVAGASVVAVSAKTAEEPVAYCDDVAAKLDTVWDEPARARLHEAFGRSGLAFGPDTAQRVAAGLDRYAERWVEAQTEACRSELEGREPSSVVASRMTCLARRRTTMGAMVHALTEADADVVMQAVEAVQSLPSLEPCLDADALGRGLPPVPEREREAVEAARSLIDQSLALRILGKLDESVERARRASADGQPLQYGPIHAEVALELATALHAAGQVEATEAELHTALRSAIAHHHDEIVAGAAAELASLELSRMGPSSVVEQWVGVGLAALDALGGRRPDLRANLMSSRANAQRRAGELDTAIETSEEVLAIREDNWGVDHYSVVEPLSELGMAYARKGDHERSVLLIERARKILHDTYGDQHPHYGALLQNLGTTHFVSGRYADALEIYQEAQRRLRDVLGPSHPSVAVLAYNVGTTLAFLERYDEALIEADRAKAIENEVYGPRSLVASTSWSLTGEIHLRAGRLDEAEAAIRKAIELSNAVAPQQRARAANFDSQLGLVLLREGKLDEARTRLDDALVVQRETSGEPSIEVAETSGRLALVMLAEGELDAARAAIDTSVQQYETTDPDPHQHAEARFRRARILLAADERSEARAEAERARALYERLGDQPSRLRAVGTWLRELDAPAPP